MATIRFTFANHVTADNSDFVADLDGYITDVAETVETFSFSLPFDLDRAALALTGLPYAPALADFTDNDDLISFTVTR